MTQNALSSMPAFSELSSPQYQKPVPRPLKSPTKTKDIRSHNRRREFLNRNPNYFENPDHELADPLRYDALVRKFQTLAEREAASRTKAYSRVLEESLMRGEARLADLVNSSTDGEAPGPTELAKDFTTESDLSTAKTKEEGLERWIEFLTERFVHGKDSDFDYNQVDSNDEYDAMERRDAEEAWFDAEDPSWASDVASSGKQKQGETGIQDF
ncbi:coiled-coil domain-containing protein-like protein [Colletotrichum truncatum]|uniref:Coiled-coil domain-containing protein-like protein n=1 Tax=Colletotrichum truncatum TaxID=5467 RepID=A0ACC3Z1A6_COLTU|nr:coiled-coil domain-containing protein-like protein [Colletotrichum truncatum]KAF6788978.1 coiled-coil domain-containing protein-like protein [Colletotrichum truncatum]